MKDTCQKTTADLWGVDWNRPWQLLRERQVAWILGCSAKALRRYRADGIGPKYLKLNGRSVRYRLGDLQDFLNLQPFGGGGAARADGGRGRPPRGAR